MFLWFEEFYFCFLPRSLSSWQSSCIHTQNSYLFLLPSCRLRNCKITKCICMSKQTHPLTLLFVGSTTDFTYEKVNTSLLSSVCDNNANWDFAHKQRRKLFWWCTKFIYVPYKWAKKYHLCSLMLFRWDTVSFLLQLLFTLVIWKKCGAEAGLDCLKSFKFSAVNQHCLPVL